MAAIHDDTTRCKNSRARLALAVGFVALALLFFGAQPAMALFCGDGILDPGEECDDGNNISGDGCTATCLVENCVDDLSGVTNNCTAEDVRIASIEVEEIDPCSAPFDTAIVRAVANLEAGANERYDIGLFVALDGGVARTGSCLHDWLPPPLNECSQLEFTNGDCGVCSLDTNVACTTDTDCASVGGSCIPPGPYDPLSPETGPFYNAEEETLVVNNLCDGGSCLFGGFPCVEDGDCPNSPGDTCGDLEQGILTQRRLFTKVCDLERTVRCEEDADCGPDGPCVVTDEIPVTCIDIDGNGKLDVGTCTSWDNNKNIAQDRFETDGFCSVGTCSQDPTQECSEDDDCPGGGNKCEFLVACDNNEFCASQDLGYCVSTLCTTVDATLPNTKAKCNCETIELDVDVPKVLEVRKIAVPFNETGLPDNGEFDLFVSTNGIDSAVCSDGGAAPCSETVGDPNDPDVCPDTDSALNPCTTTVIRVEAGFCSDSGSPCTQSRDCPGDEFCDPSDLRVGETATDANTSLANYTTFIECRDAVGVCSGNDQIPCLDDQICQDAGAGTCAFDPLGSCDTDTTNALVDCETDTDGNPYLPLPISNVETNIFCLIRNEALIPGFDAEVTIVKDGDELSKVGDEVDYTITVENTSTGALAPDLDCTITDPLLGLNENVILEPGVPQTITPTYTVQAGDPDPLVNTATIDCTVVNFPSIAVSDSDTHTVELFTVDFSITKDGDELSKAGDAVSYDFVLTNNSSANAPELTCTATDDVLGEIYATAVLPAGATNVSDVPYTIPADAVGSVTNEVTLSCSLPAEYTNVLEDATASHTVELFTVDFSITKDGDELSKAGDAVSYDFVLTNNSSANAPELTCTATDDVLGEIYATAVLPAGATNVSDVPYTIPADAVGSVTNEVTLSCSLPAEYTNVLEDATASHTVELFTVDFSITKDGDELSKAGDEVSYDFVLTNNSSANAPELTCTATDDVLGEIYATAVLPAGATNVSDVPYTIPADAVGSVTNEVTLSCSLPAEYTNVLEDATASHTVELFTVDFSITKDGDELSKAGDAVSYDFVLTNNSSANAPELTCTATDDVLGEIYATAVLPAGATNVSDVPYTIPADAVGSVTNEVTLSCSLPAEYTNVLEDATASHTVELFTVDFSITKDGDELSKAGDAVSYDFVLTNNSSANAPELTCTATDDVLGEIYATAVLPAGATNVSDVPYTIPADAVGSVTNEVTLSCSLPAEYTNVLEDATASHTVELFTVDFSITKDGDELSKAGDAVSYDFVLTNNSSANAPELTCTATDDVLGEIYATAVLPAGATNVSDVPYTIPADAVGSVTNEVTLSCSLPAEYTNVLEDATASHTVELFTVDFSITKDGDELSKAGDEVSYDFVLTNNSSANAPELTCTATDDVLGEIYATAVLPAGATNVSDVPYTIPADAVGSVTNEVTLSCSLPAEYTNVLEDATASHTVELFTVDFSITKDGDELSKAGDAVSYDFVLTNNSSANAPELTCTATDDVLGEIYATAVLPAGATNVSDVPYTIPADAVGSVTNEVTLSCSLPAEYTNVLEDATASHTVELFTVDFSITKDGDELSKAGDAVSYDFVLTNNSSANAPELTCTATDDVLGEIYATAVLPAGATNVSDVPYTIPADAVGSVTNEVTLSCSLPAEYTNVLEDATASHTVELFTVDFSITKDGDELSKAGDAVSYDFVLTNNSSANAPELTCTATDDVLGEIYATAVLPAGATNVSDVPYTIPADAVGSVTNEVTLSCSLPAEYTNVLEDATASHTVELFTVDFSITKDGDELSKAGDAVSYDFVLTNNSSANAPELTCTATDDVLGEIYATAVLPAGATNVSDVPYTIPADAVGSVTNEVTLSCSLPAEYTNVLEDATASHTVELFTVDFSITKDGDELSKAGDAVSYDFVLTNNSSANAPELTCTATDDVLGEIYATAVLPAGATNVSDVPYTIPADAVGSVTNEVTLSCSLPAEYTNVLEDATASHTVELFTVDFSITKDGDELSKAGDAVSYDFVLTNNSSANAPELTCTATDDVLGEIYATAVLPAGATNVSDVPYTIPADAVGSVTNEVTLSCSLPAEYTNVLEDATASHTVELFTVDFSITKDGDELSKAGDAVSYDFVLTNNSSANAPELTCTATDDVLGEIYATAVLPAGATNVSDVPYTIPADAVGSVTNEVTLSCSLPAEYTNVLEDATASHTVELFTVDFSITKDGDELSKAGDAVSYDFVLTNNSSANAPELTCTATDDVLGEIYATAVLPAGATNVSDVPYTIPADAVGSVTNEVTLSCSLPAEYTNVLEDATASHTVELFTVDFSITKDGDELSKAGDAVSYDFVLTNNSSANAPELTCTATDDVLGEIYATAVLPAGATNVSDVPYTIPADAVGSVTNEVTLSCSLPAEYTNVLEDATASHTVELFTVDFSITKDGDELSKAGDAVSYDFVLTNNSSANAPELTCTATDDVLGEIYATAVLPAGATNVSDVPYTIPADAVGSVTNEVTLSCSLPAEYTNVLEDATASHTVELFTVDFSITKDGDELSKAGDAVSYDFVLTNNSSANAPELTCTATDDVLGEIYATAVLPAGATNVSDVPYTIPADAVGSVTNEVTLSCSLPAEYTNVLEDATASHTVELFTVDFSITKDGDELSKAGDAVSYDFVLTNNSSANAPELTCTATDDVLGEIYATAVLPAGATNVSDVPYTIPADAVGSVTNEVTLSCSLPAEYTNVLEDATASHTVELFTVDFSITKDGDELSKAGDAVSYDFVLTNNSSANAPELTCTATDDVLGEIYATAVLPAGATNVSDVPYTIPADAVGSVTNEVTLSCSLPAEYTNVLEDATASHTVELFTVDFSITKDGDELSKAGDEVSYDFVLTNNSSANAPELTCTATDDVLGEIYATAVLPAGATNVSDVPYTIPADAVGSVTNEVTLSCSLPAEYTNVLEDATASHTVELFTVDFSITKDGDELSKAGDAVSYDFVLTNNSSANAPELTCTATDDVLGEIYATAVLPAGATNVSDVPYTIPADAVGSVTNEVTLSCSLPAEYTNVLEDATASHTVELFTVDFSITKDGDELSKAGDEVSYDFVLTNNSSANTPPLTCTAEDSDPRVGVIFGPNVLPPGDTPISRTILVTADDSDPLSNTVTLSCSLPDQFTNVLEDASDSHTVDLVHPSYTVTKTCTNEPVPQDGPATWTVVFENTGDVPLIITADDDDIGTFNLPNGMGSMAAFPVSQPGPFAGQATVSNTVNSSAVLAIPGTFTNVIAPQTASDTCVVAGEAKITKLTQGLPNEPPNPETRDWRFTLQDCSDNDPDVCEKDDAVIGDVTSPPSMVEFGADLVPVELDPNQTYRLCEVLIPVAWTNTWKGDIDDDGIPETQIPFVPAVNDDPVQDPPGWSNVFDPMFAPPPAIWTNDERCLNFVADAGKTEVFEIDNQFPGGEPRTIGYWKNWDSCSGGGQVNTAIDNCGPTPAERLSGGCALLDDVLQPPGIDIGLLNLQADADVFNCDQGTQDARNILDKRSIDDGRKRANDPAYGLAAQLLAAIANETAGAGVCPEAGQAIIDGQMLLVAIEFDGTGDYFKKRNRSINGYTKQDANDLALLLDSYNNGTLCVP